MAVLVGDGRRLPLPRQRQHPDPYRASTRAGARGRFNYAMRLSRKATTAAERRRAPRSPVVQPIDSVHSESAASRWLPPYRGNGRRRPSPTNTAIDDDCDHRRRSVLAMPSAAQQIYFDADSEIMTNPGSLIFLLEVIIYLNDHSASYNVSLYGNNDCLSHGSNAGRLFIAHHCSP